VRNLVKGANMTITDDGLHLSNSKELRARIMSSFWDPAAVNCAQWLKKAGGEFRYSAVDTALSVVRGHEHFYFWPQTKLLRECGLIVRSDLSTPVKPVPAFAASVILKAAASFVLEQHKSGKSEKRLYHIEVLHCHHPGQAPIFVPVKLLNGTLSTQRPYVALAPHNGVR
jgi:hypothetical protein